MADENFIQWVGIGASAVLGLAGLLYAVRADRRAAQAHRILEEQHRFAQTDRAAEAQAPGILDTWKARIVQAHQMQRPKVDSHEVIVLDVSSAAHELALNRLLEQREKYPIAQVNRDAASGTARVVVIGRTMYLRKYGHPWQAP